MKNDNFNEEMSHIGGPQFPGQQLGNKSINDIRAIIKRQKRLKGYNLTVPVGGSGFNLDLSGTARILLGIALFGKSTKNIASDSWNTFVDIETVEFQVNNEIVIDQLDPNFLTQQFNNNEYYYIPRPLSGTDQLTLRFTNPGANAEVVKVVIYYI